MDVESSYQEAQAEARQLINELRGADRCKVRGLEGSDQRLFYEAKAR